MPTTTGRTCVRLISHFRPEHADLLFSRHEWAVQQMIMYRGAIRTRPRLPRAPSTARSAKAIETAKESVEHKAGDRPSPPLAIPA